MDPLTHALSGAVLGGMLPCRSRLRWLVSLWAAGVAALPDIDIFFVHNPLEYIEYHRGITHSLAGAVGLALIALLPLIWLERRFPASPPRPARRFGGAFLLAYGLLLLHIYLDCMNSYGTQVFQPFSSYRVRWNALFIVDPLLLLPLLYGALFGLRRRCLLVGLLVWTLVYPLGALAIRVGAESTLRAELPQAGTFEQLAQPDSPALPGPANWDTVQTLALVPDAFGPLHWKMILGRDQDWDVAGYTLGQGLPERFTVWRKVPEPLWSRLGQASEFFRVYAAYAPYPAWDAFLPAAVPPAGEYIFGDLRFGSTISFVDAVQGGGEGRTLTFRILARLNEQGQPETVRLVTTRGAGGDSGWVRPQKP